MKIVIKADGHNIRLWFPLSIIKSRIAYSVAKNSLENQSRKHIAKQSAQKTSTGEEQEELQVEVVADTSEQAAQIEQEIAKDIALTREQMVQIYNILKQCVKVHGHFNIVEVDSHEGEKVVIRV